MRILPIEEHHSSFNFGRTKPCFEILKETKSINLTPETLNTDRRGSKIRPFNIWKNLKSGLFYGQIEMVRFQMVDKIQTSPDFKSPL